MKKKTVEASAVRLPAPQAEPAFPSLEGKVVVLVCRDAEPISLAGMDGAGEGSGKIDYPMFFAWPSIKADLLIFSGIQLLWDEENMARFGRSLEAFRKANPSSAVVMDASTSPLFKGLAKLHEEGKINCIIDSPMGEGRAIELGLEILSILRG